MRSLEITQYSEEGDSDLELLPKSKKLFDSFQQSIKGTEYFRDRHNYDTAKTIPYEVLLEYGEKCYLSALSKSPDGPETIEILFGFDAKTAFQNPQLNLPTFGNMGGTLGLILEMLDQSDQAFDDQTFRDCIMYGGCSGFTDYIPSKQFSDVLSHWRMFQLREYYVYALYEFWIFFLDILRTNGPFSFDKFRKYLDKNIDLSSAAKIFGLELPEKKLSQLSLDETLEAILSQSKIKSGNFEDRCKKYAKLYKVIANESSLQSLLDTNEELSQENLLGIFFFMLASIYLRLIGIQTDDPSNSWHWAREGTSRRRSMALFVQQMNENRAENKTLLQIFEWLFRDYVLAQHTITAIEKWQQRSTNTFHFKYENGIYEWVEQDSNGFTGS
jgi:hypothetical protein